MLAGMVLQSQGAGRACQPFANSPYHYYNGNRETAKHPHRKNSRRTLYGLRRVFRL